MSFHVALILTSEDCVARAAWRKEHDEVISRDDMILKTHIHTKLFYMMLVRISSQRNMQTAIS